MTPIHSLNCTLPKRNLNRPALTTQEKIQALVTAIRRAREGVAVELPHWQDDPLLAPLTTELQQLLAEMHSNREQAISRQRDFYEGVLDQIPTDFALLDTEARYLYMSAFAVRDPDLRKWLIGKTDLDFCSYRNIDPQLAYQRMAKHGEALHTGQPTQILEVRPNREGVMTHKMRIFIPITSPQGEQLIAGYCHDITEILLHEQSLLAKNEALEKANYELDQFVYRASHDLRAPLASVQGLLELALAAESQAEAQPYLQLMLRATAKMDSFIRDIVHHSKNARLEIQIEPIDLQAAFDDTLEQLRFMAGADRVEVTLALQINAPLHSDPFRIGVLLNNLISNGIKYHDSKKESPHVWVNATIEPHECVIEVRDNGIGIAAEHLAHVFEMFFRATHVATGTGIGLYIVQEVARKLGGSATLSSELGVGTTFIVRFANAVLGEE